MWNKTCFIFSYLVVCVLSYDEKRLTRHLVNNYEQIGLEGRPLKDPKEALDVHHKISLINILNLDEETQQLTVNVWEYLLWKDEVLKWSPSDFGGVEEIRVDTKHIFVPDTMTFNSVERQKTVDTLAIVYNSGDVMTVTPVILSAPCTIEDESLVPQFECSLKYGSWTYDGHKINLTSFPDPVDVSSFVANPKFELINANASRHSVTYECCPEPYIDIEYRLILKKKN